MELAQKVEKMRDRSYKYEVRDTPKVYTGQRVMSMSQCMSMSRSIEVEVEVEVEGNKNCKSKSQR